MARRIERAIAEGALAPSERLPTVRELARQLGVSPATAAATYSALKRRGLVTANRRQGTVVAERPPLRVRGSLPLPSGVRDLASGNPDPALLPKLAPALARVDTEQRLYGGAAKLTRLVELATDDFAADGIEGEIAIVGGALDGIERTLQAQLRPGDRVAIEDPSWPRIADLVRALSLEPEPVRVDERGLVPGAVADALARDVKALIATPRGQNPFGGAIDRQRGDELRTLLGRHPEVLVVVDDYLGAVAGVAYEPIQGATEHWVVIRSLSKIVGPDLRIAVLVGDPTTVSRVEGRQLLGPGWVSHILQQVAANLWGAPATKRLLARAERVYAERRAALVEALARQGIDAHGATGLGVWIPVEAEAPVVQFLLERGWGVSAGERYRFRAPPGIRITTTTLLPTEAFEVADAVADAVAPGSATYTG